MFRLFKALTKSFCFLCTRKTNNCPIWNTCYFKGHNKTCSSPDSKYWRINGSQRSLLQHRQRDLTYKLIQAIKDLQTAFNVVLCIFSFFKRSHLTSHICLIFRYHKEIWHGLFNEAKMNLCHSGSLKVINVNTHTYVLYPPEQVDFSSKSWIYLSNNTPGCCHTVEISLAKNYR